MYYVHMYSARRMYLYIRYLLLRTWWPKSQRRFAALLPVGRAFMEGQTPLAHQESVGQSEGAYYGGSVYCKLQHAVVSVRTYAPNSVLLSKFTRVHGICCKETSSTSVFWRAGK